MPIRQMTLHLEEDDPLDTLWNSWDANLQLKVARAYAKPLAAAVRVEADELTDEREVADEE